MRLQQSCLVLPLLAALPAVAQQCYWPDGSLAKGYIACSTTDSQCCASGEACLSNGLCYGATIGMPYRGACTDKTWATSKCSSICNDNWPSTWANLFQCPNSDSGQWWCGNTAQTTACEAGTNGTLFTWPAGKPQKIVGIASTTTPVSSETTAASSAPTTPTSSDSPSTGTPASQGSNSDSGSNSNSKSLAIGLGIGLGLGLPLSVIGVALLLLREKRKNNSNSSQNGERPYNYDNNMYNVSQHYYYNTERKPVELSDSGANVHEIGHNQTRIPELHASGTPITPK